MQLPGLALFGLECRSLDFAAFDLRHDEVAFNLACVLSFASVGGRCTGALPLAGIGADTMTFAFSLSGRLGP